MQVLPRCLAFVLLCSLGACDQPSEPEPQDLAEPAPAAPSPPYRLVTFVQDPSCAPGSEAQWSAVASAFAAWQSFGVELVESATPLSPSPDAVSVCLHDGEFWSWRYGATAWSEDGMRMDLRTDIDQPDRHRVLWAIAAHEMLHVVLATNEHSGTQGDGLTRTRACSACSGFTPADIAWVESRGLAWHDTAP